VTGFTVLRAALVELLLFGNLLVFSHSRWRIDCVVRRFSAVEIRAAKIVCLTWNVCPDAGVPGFVGAFFDLPACEQLPHNTHSCLFSPKKHSRSV
jgi:hypothetical protein